MKTSSKKQPLTLVLGLALSIAAAPAYADNAKKQDPSIERGRYLVSVAGCNDCHTAQFSAKDGKVPESEWLTGDIVGWHGPWGTTYSTNLRILMSSLSEKQWLSMARSLKTRPPMPWYIVNQMTDQDLRAIYRFIRSLGPAGKTVPEFLAPQIQPPQPFIDFPAAP